MYGSRLTRDFGDSCPETWRRAIEQLKDYEVQRGLARLLRTGAPTPTLPAFVKACRIIGEDDGPSAPRGLPELPQGNYDMYHAFGQRAMLAWLMTNGAATAESLAVMIACKNDVVSLYRDFGRHDKVDPAELKEQLFAEFSKVWSPMDYEESEAGREAYCAKQSLNFEPISREEYRSRNPS